MREKSKYKSLYYIIIVLALSWSFTFILFQDEKQALKSFALVMFIPLITAIIFSRFSSMRLQETAAFFSLKRLRLSFVLFGILFPLIVIAGITAVNLMLGISQLKPISSHDYEKLLTVIGSFIPAFLSAYGEEAGWRGYLLPSLAEKYSYLKAAVITGIVWALFHIPVVYLLGKVQHVQNPGVVSLVQAAAAFSFSFAFAFIYIKSNSLIPVVLLHAIWNMFNPYILGDVYTNEPGLVKGNIFTQNGEGTVGLIVLSFFAIFFIYKISTIDKERKGIQNIEKFISGVQ